MKDTMDLNPASSLNSVLDALAEPLFFGGEIPRDQRVAAARWIAARQGLPRSYGGMFAPTDGDAKGIRLFTGEPVVSRAGIGHLLGEEACRILTVLEVKEPVVQTALHRAVGNMSELLESSEKRGYDTSMYCCGTCSSGYWRNLALGIFPRSEERLHRGLRRLKDLRNEEGRWQKFPFYHTSLALVEIGPSLAKDELRYAARTWERILPRLARAKDRYAQRRASVGRRLLELCSS
ncbi:hypothetical protein DB347_12040 [Opitutaceae bacterium EW11]|nr:hypothetical protein DB347_12040 [Opitutaceae bacterium EW11]